MFCAPGLIFDGIDGVVPCFDVLRARTLFWRCRVRRFLFSCFARPTHFLRYRGRRVSFSYFALPDFFSMVPSASGPIFIFCVLGIVFMFSAPGNVFGHAEGVGSLFHVLRSLTCFWRYRGHQILFSRFARRDSLSAEPRATTTVFMFFIPTLIFGGTKGVGSRFQASRSRARFRRYGWCRVSISYFALPDSFSAVPSASRPVSCFALPNMFSVVSSASGPVYMFCSPELVFGC
jgi:hypothetical protein